MQAIPRTVNTQTYGSRCIRNKHAIIFPFHIYNQLEVGTCHAKVIDHQNAKSAVQAVSSDRGLYMPVKSDVQLE